MLYLILKVLNLIIVNLNLLNLIIVNLILIVDFFYGGANKSNLDKEINNNSKDNRNNKLIEISYSFYNNVVNINIMLKYVEL